MEKETTKTLIPVNNCQYDLLGYDCDGSHRFSRSFVSIRYRNNAVDFDPADRIRDPFDGDKV